MPALKIATPVPLKERRFSIIDTKNGNTLVEFNAVQMCSAEALATAATFCIVNCVEVRELRFAVELEEAESRSMRNQIEEIMNKIRARVLTKRLTKRERQVLHLILESRSNKEIAYQISLSERTVKFHVSSLLAKYGVQSRLQLARKVGSSLPEIERLEL